MLTRTVQILLGILACSTICAQISPLPTRIAKQNALFSKEYRRTLQESPLLATSLGDYRFNHLLDDSSLEATRKRNTEDKIALAALQAISTQGFTEQDALSHQLMVISLQQRIENYRLKQYEMPVTHLSGAYITLSDLPLSVPFDSAKHYEDYIARLRQIPRELSRQTEVLRAGLQDHLVPTKSLLETIPVICDGIVKANPFLLPTKSYPASISAADQQKLTDRITEISLKQVLPAYQKFSNFIATEYAPHGRTSPSITSLPNGEELYQNAIYESTTTRLSPEDIHQIGLRQMQVIGKQIALLAMKQGYSDPVSFRKAMLGNPKYHATSAEQIVDDYRKYIAQMRPKLKELFTVIPDTPVTVEAAPAFQVGGSTHYQSGTLDGKMPGRIVVATSDFRHRLLIGDEAIAYHEGIPGHHMQFSVAQQLQGVPEFRKILFNSGYIEGWALYSEELGKEVGFYQDPGSELGRLGADLFRAARLVVDTGIHKFGWTREQAVEYIQKNIGLDGPSTLAEVDRYIAWPGQALSYTLGEMKFNELRARSEKELGSKFDLRKFNDQMLANGVLPLDTLDQQTDLWLSQQKLQ